MSSNIQRWEAAAQGAVTWNDTFYSIASYGVPMLGMIGIAALVYYKVLGIFAAFCLTAVAALIYIWRQEIRHLIGTSFIVDLVRDVTSPWTVYFAGVRGVVFSWAVNIPSTLLRHWQRCLDQRAIEDSARSVAANSAALQTTAGLVHAANEDLRDAHEVVLIVNAELQEHAQHAAQQNARISAAVGQIQGVLGNPVIAARIREVREIDAPLGTENADLQRQSQERAQQADARLQAVLQRINARGRENPQ